MSANRLADRIASDLDFFGGNTKQFIRVQFGLNVRRELEGRNHSFRQQNLFTRTRIARWSRFTVLDGKGSEATQFDVITRRERFGNRVEKFFDDRTNVGLDITRRTGNLLDQVLFRYVWHPINIGWIYWNDKPLCRLSTSDFYFLGGNRWTVRE